MAEDPQPLTLQQRIAALNSAHIGRVPGDPPPTRPKPEIPNRRPQAVSHKTINIPPANVNGSVTQAKVGNLPNGPPPPLPSRKQPPPPPLPQRKSSSDDQSRRTSITTINSTSTTATDTSLAVITRTKSQDSGRVKAPAWGECELPPLPARNATTKTQKVTERPKSGNRLPSNTRVLPPPDISQTTPDTTVTPNSPPCLPSRPAQKPSQTITTPASRRLSPVVSPAALKEAENAGFSKINRRTSSANNNHIIQEEDESTQHVSTSSYPPPIPLSSRPDLSALQATKPRPTTNGAHNQRSQPTSLSTGCMTCRDFSAPDHHASLFPRRQCRSLPDLAIQLTAPFSSLTDKARAIFTWLHHNVHYDVANFFAGTLKPSSPDSTLHSGLAVCEGYAALFTNLATHAGLESLVVGGHGKGFGYTQLSPGSPLPPYNGNHAWNAVRIDNGHWKLIDPCWGAGHVQGASQPYNPHFNPSMFTMTNEEFGLKHFPQNKSHFFLPDNRTLTWDQYIQIDADRWPNAAEPPTVFTNAKTDYGIGDRTVTPRDRRIQVRNSNQDTVRFQFSLLCPHWTLEHHTRKGRPPVFMLAVHGLDGRDKDHIPLEHRRGSNTPSGGGDIWYVDIPARNLGAPGQTITLFAVTSFGDRKDARGLSVREFREGKGRVAMGFTGIAAWDLV